jgi:predicted 2-oxoglutarate/Fe(II)-dependent dioxygenase YbiX/alkyl hydroperoxide reductase subunit AhpC
MASQSAPRDYTTLHVGDHAPWFRQRCIGQQNLFSFDMAAGRFIALCFYGSASGDAAQDALTLANNNDSIFDGINLSFFGVSNDVADDSNEKLNGRPGIRHFADTDGAISRAYGVLPENGTIEPSALRQLWYVLDPRLRIIGVFPMDPAGSAAALHYLGALPKPASYNSDAPVPIVMIPHVLEPEFCARLINLYRTKGGTNSAILTEGATLTDHGFKRRRDCRITDPALVAQTQTRIFRRIVPEIRHVFQFEATRLERLIVACYDAAERGRFGPHRDNTIAATAHRRFAISINLNDDFEGGSVSFPEYSAREFRPAPGAALVFSCSMLHCVAPMISGRRYACLPFVYDDIAAENKRKGLLF